MDRYQRDQRELNGAKSRRVDAMKDPVHSCDLYRDKSAGSCAHVDGPLCDFPECSMLADYRAQKEGMTIAGNGAAELGKLMREQHGKRGPVPHA